MTLLRNSVTHRTGSARVFRYTVYREILNWVFQILVFCMILRGHSGYTGYMFSSIP